LSVVGRKWQEHLYEMDYLKEGIGLRAMAQRDPLVEYQREGFEMFQSMMAAIREESVGFLFNLEVQVENAPEAAVGVVDDTPMALMDRVAGAGDDGEHNHVAPRITAPGLEAPAKPAQLQFSAPDAQGDAETHIERRSSGDGLPPSAKRTGNKNTKKKKKR
ncbi:MAG: preprotein translocase subunit SecA, partial [Specibacter sp.]